MHSSCMADFKLLSVTAPLPISSLVSLQETLLMSGNISSCLIINLL